MMQSWYVRIEEGGGDPRIRTSGNRYRSHEFSNVSKMESPTFRNPSEISDHL